MKQTNKIFIDNISIKDVISLTETNTAISNILFFAYHTDNNMDCCGYDFIRGGKLITDTNNSYFSYDISDNSNYFYINESTYCVLEKMSNNKIGFNIKPVYKE